METKCFDLIADTVIHLRKGTILIWENEYLSWYLFGPHMQIQPTVD
jgi:hypothetical protein